jgi:hypothetical protein
MCYADDSYSIFICSISISQGPSVDLMIFVFQCMLRLCRPRKTILMFVIRDKTNAYYSFNLMRQPQGEILMIQCVVLPIQILKYVYVLCYFSNIVFDLRILYVHINCFQCTAGVYEYVIEGNIFVFPRSC